jgi:MazG family protein
LTHPNQPPIRAKLPPAKGTGIEQLVWLMSKLRAPEGCPWDREQDHMTLRLHAVEEVYELLDAIEAGDDHEMVEELGDLLLQVVFHAQLAKERAAFDFDKVCRTLVEKLLRRHPHVFGDLKAGGVDQVLANWETIKRAEKHGTKHERPSALDGIPRHLPALLRAEKLVKKARKAGLLPKPAAVKVEESRLARELFDLATQAQAAGLSAESLLRGETKRREKALRKAEKRAGDSPA